MSKYGEHSERCESEIKYVFIENISFSIKNTSFYFSQFPVKPLYRQSHNIEIRTIYA